MTLRCGLNSLRFYTVVIMSVFILLLRRVYYFQNKATIESNRGGLDSPKPLAANEQQAAEIAQLKETNRILRCQVSDLQADNVQLRLRLTAAQAQAVVDSANAGTSASGGGGSALEQQVNHIEENRKKEKEATALLLEHDEKVIRQLNDEITELRKKHTQDAEIIGDCAERSIALTEILTAREAMVSELGDSNQALVKQVDALKDQLRRQDILLVKKYTDEERVAYGIQGSNFNTTSSLAPSLSSAGANPWSHSLQPPGDGGDFSVVQSPAQSNRQPLSPMSSMKQSQLESLLFTHTPGAGTGADTDTDNDTGTGSLLSSRRNRPNPNPNTNSIDYDNANDNSLTLIGSPDGHSQSQSQPQPQPQPRHSSLGSPLGLGSPGQRAGMNTSSSSSSSSTIHNSTSALGRNAFLGFSAQTAWEELHSLRREKALLIKALQEGQVKLVDTVEAHEKESKLP